MGKFFQGLSNELYERVWVSKRSTILGLAISAGIIVASYTLSVLQSIPKGWALAAAGIVSLILGLLKNEEAVMVSKTLKLLPLLFALSLAPAARADGAPATGPLSAQLTKDLSLHLNLQVPAFAYSITKNQVLGQVTFGVAYTLDYKGLVALGGGGSYVQTNDTPGLTATALLGGPVLSFLSFGDIQGRPAFLYEYKWAGGVHENIVAGTIAFQLGK